MESCRGQYGLKVLEITEFIPTSSYFKFFQGACWEFGLVGRLWLSPLNISSMALERPHQCSCWFILFQMTNGWGSWYKYASFIDVPIFKNSNYWNSEFKKVQFFFKNLKNSRNWKNLKILKTSTEKTQRDKTSKKQKILKKEIWRISKVWLIPL